MGLIRNLFYPKKEQAPSEKQVEPTEIELDLTFNVESEKQGRYLVFSSFSSYEKNPEDREISFGYVLLDEDLKCVETDYCIIYGSEKYAEHVNKILLKAKYIIAFKINNALEPLISNDVEPNGTIPIGLMELAAEYVGIQHPTKNEYKWPSLYELVLKLFSPDGKTPVKYDKGRDRQSKLDAKLFIKMMQLNLIDLDKLK